MTARRSPWAVGEESHKTIKLFVCLPDRHTNKSHSLAGFEIKNSQMDCLFCKIINKELPSGIVFENSIAVAIKDIYPKAPVHILIIPKKHIVSINQMEEADKELMGGLFLIAKQIAVKKKLNGYKLLFTGKTFKIIVCSNISKFISLNRCEAVGYLPATTTVSFK